MTIKERHGLAALTDKEKQTLRLIVRGHDAKSVAQTLDLSVHTINERLRDARRKLSVSSSREAARMLLDAEGGMVVPPPPEKSGDMTIGEDRPAATQDQAMAPIGGVGRGGRRFPILIGALLMTLALGLIALVGLPHMLATSPQDAPVASAAHDPAVVDAAQRFLALVDQGRWADSYRATGSAFRRINSEAVWAAASEKMRAQMGTMVSRSFLSQENLPAPPDGYEVVKFRARYSRSGDVIETVTLEHQAGAWRIVGITVG
ncbi:DNA-binding CsgD family transcriptional regulator [Sphingomonas sp. SORGH_AS870]|uniref:helix-turn-helix domain-containing protein n=1 Tax=Sphingomonas sp. SORGH_AS_0870 TaxID=3041801 RepID=UPI00285642A7|nr:DUF4019 domain-containing protein [Sphingomonas sp. SORGH_AS_0870]MDR6147044.1 DNA-binding CsgD family transcriptional regulator [Sphingomonas sp. SORGH_AS_0870]